MPGVNQRYSSVPTPVYNPRVDSLGSPDWPNLAQIWPNWGPFWANLGTDKGGDESFRNVSSHYLYRRSSELKLCLLVHTHCSRLSWRSL